MKDSRVFGVNQRGDFRWCAWTCFVNDDGTIDRGSFVELSIHDDEPSAHKAANEARARHLSACDEEAA
jgi:hypothetical protein